MRKIIKRLFIVIAILLFVIAFCFKNIKSNSVYYAKHTPNKEGTEPVLMMLVDNLEWIYNPKVKTLKYDFDGQPCVQFFNSNGKQTGYISQFCGYDKNKKTIFMLIMNVKYRLFWIVILILTLHKIMDMKLQN